MIDVVCQRKTGVKDDSKIFLVLATGRRSAIYLSGEDCERSEEGIPRAQFWTWIKLGLAVRHLNRSAGVYESGVQERGLAKAMRLDEVTKRVSLKKRDIQGLSLGHFNI